MWKQIIKKQVKKQTVDNVNVLCGASFSMLLINTCELTNLCTDVSRHFHTLVSTGPNQTELKYFSCSLSGRQRSITGD